MEKKKQGGKREGSGRKKKEPTVTVSFRIKESEKENVKKVVKDYINK